VTVATCCGSGSTFARLSRAAAKAASARLRRLGVLPIRADWAARAAICERCPLRVVFRGTTYCGRPFVHRVHREPVADGCGCPTLAKAKDPAEHCPLDASHRGAVIDPSSGCTCKWCSL
jgi:hypothetical protein